MTAESRALELDRMLARDAIRDVLSRYARGIDRADAALLKGCYFDDAVEEHGSSFSGRAHDYVDAAIPKVRGMGVMQHLLGNNYIELDGDRAYVETYIWTFLRVERDGRSWDTFTGGRLHDRFERRNGVWKIAHRRTVFDWNRDTPFSEGCAWATSMRAPPACGAGGRTPPTRPTRSFERKRNCARLDAKPRRSQ